MDDFEYAVESQTLPSFLKQDQDHGSTSNTTAQEGGGGLVGENELDRLMREMSEADINAFAEELGGDVGKVGLMVPEGSQPLEGKGVESVGRRRWLKLRLGERWSQRRRCHQIRGRAGW
jgi:hypothetical protein